MCTASAELAEPEGPEPLCLGEGTAGALQGRLKQSYEFLAVRSNKRPQWWH